MFDLLVLKRDVINIIFLNTAFWLLFRNIIGGIGFISISSQYPEKSSTYQILIQIMPLYLWGLLMIVSAFLFGLTFLVFLLNQDYFYVINGMAGLFGSIVWGMYAASSLAAAIEETETFSVHSWGYALTTFVHLSMLILAIAILWQKKTIKTI